MRRKSGETLKEAVALQRANCFSGSANRAYYAIFQALVGELQNHAKRPKPSDFGPQYYEQDHPDRWTHRLIRHLVWRGDLLQLDSREQALLRMAWALRGKADYEPAPIRADELKPVLDELPEFLRAQGVPLEQL